MKKIVIILVAVIGLSIGANAQQKKTTTSAQQKNQTSAAAQQQTPPPVAVAHQKQQKSYAYCQLAGRKKPFTTKINVSVDYGEKKRSGSSGIDIGSGGSGNGDFIVGENGKRIKFNSMIDAMNYMGTQGWEFVQAFVVIFGNQQEIVYVLKKEITMEEQKQMEDDLNKDE